MAHSDVCIYYIALFCARTDVYQEYRDHWTPVRAEITPEAVEAGLTGSGPSLGGYFPNADGTSHVFAVDLDLDQGFAMAGQLASQMRSDGVIAYVEDSREGRAHLWGFLDRPLDAKPIRRFLRAEIERAGFPRVFDKDRKRLVDDPRIELRPGADSLPSDGFGHALRLPTMPNPKTGRRYRLFDADLSPLTSKLGDVLLALETNDPQRLADVSAGYVPIVDPSTIDKHWLLPKPPREHDAFDDMTVTEVLRERWGVLNARPGHAVKCPAHEDARPSLSIARDDRRAFCKSPTCEIFNGGRGRGTYELFRMAPVSA